MAATPCTGQQVGPRTGALTQMPDFDALVAAYQAQVEYFTRLIVNGCNYGQLAQAERGPLPYCSTLTDDCIARGRDLNEGGARYSYHSLMFFGAPNVADSLYALKQMLFVERAVAPEELLAASARQFPGARGAAPACYCTCQSMATTRPRWTRWRRWLAAISATI